MPRESMHYDVVIVGAGPAGLAAAIRLKQRSAGLSVCVLEKGSEIGAHILSGAVMDPRALAELFPDWKETGAPLNTPVSEDRFLFLTESGSFKTPDFLLPACFKNHGNYVISLGNLTRWLGKQAEGLGVEIFPGFAAAEVLYEGERVKGVATGNLGISRSGEKTGAYQPGMELHAKYTFFAEGSRGHLGRQLFAKFRLERDADPQVYGIGLKELWEVKAERHQPGLVLHSAGWPLDADTYGGSFLYHMEDRQVAVGFVVGLGYSNPFLSPYEEFQRFKTHPAIRRFLEGGKRICYGARAITAGGLQSLPKLALRGALPRPQLQALDVQGALYRLADGRRRPDTVTRQSALDAATPSGGPSDAEKQGFCKTHCLSQARWCAELRPVVVGVHLQHQQHRGQAGPPDPQGSFRTPAESEDLCGAGAALLPCRCLRVRGPRDRAAPADQRAELRALQDLRHQGPDAEHRLGRAGRRRRPQLSQHVDC